MPNPVLSSSSYEEFRAAWLEDVVGGEPSTLALGRRFAEKLVAHWLDLDQESIDTVYCDGAGDGGIDIAVLRRGETAPEPATSVEGDTWYLVQSKYGSAFSGPGTLIREAQKVFDTLEARRSNLSSLAAGLAERLQNFLSGVSEDDRLVLVYATVDALDDEDKRVVGDIRSMGRARLGPVFDVETVSVFTIWERTLEEVANVRSFSVPLRGTLVPCSDTLLIGAVSLASLYEFLRSYRNSTSDLDQIYEKNVRRFLGPRGKVNRGMRDTLQTRPDLFGLFNNGITVVVTNFIGDDSDSGVVHLIEPYIVNGCQTTRTIWEVLQQRLDTGGTGSNPALDVWRDQVQTGVVVTKIVKVGDEGEDMLHAITRFTNTQNAVRERDFLALHGDLRTWKSRLEGTHGIYLEIQRGGWESRRAWQRQNPTATPQFSEWANAFDLIKVYGAGWMREPGIAFAKNGPFLPGGTIFQKVMDDPEYTGGFDADDLFAAYLLQTSATELKFGRGADKPQRRQTRFLFYMIVMELLRDALIRAQLPSQPKELTRAFLAIFQGGNENSRDALLNTAIEALDGYMTAGEDGSVHQEPAFRSFNSDLNAFLKWEKLGKSDETTPMLRGRLAAVKQAMGMRFSGHPSVREQMLTALGR